MTTLQIPLWYSTWLRELLRSVNIGYRNRLADILDLQSVLIEGRLSDLQPICIQRVESAEGTMTDRMLSWLEASSEHRGGRVPEDHSSA